VGSVFDGHGLGERLSRDGCVGLLTGQLGLRIGRLGNMVFKQKII